MNPFIKTATLTAALTLAFAAVNAPAAHAGEVSFGYHKKHVSIGVHVGGCERAPICPPRPIGYARREWIEGHWTTVTDQVWVEARVDRVWIPPVHETRYDACGRKIRVCVRQGYWDNVCVPGHFETATRQVFVPGGWRVRPC